jgi:hypothetical protein
VRQSGKNSADIRMVVDALDLCYTKAHVDTFVIISGDSDFSPLVSKLRENAKRVIGVGVKNSTSDLLVANCDEFIFYDDLVREVRRAAAKRDERKTQPQQGRRPPSDESNRKKEEMEARKLQALEMVVETFDALVSERGDTGKIWASLLKDTLKRRRPDFSETYYGFRTFGNLLEDAQTRGLFEFGRDEKSGTYVYRSNSGQGNEALGAVPDVEQVHAVPELTAGGAGTPDRGDQLAAEMQGEQPSEVPAAAPVSAREPRRRGGRGRKGREQGGEQGAEQAAEQAAAQVDASAAPYDVQDDASMASWPAPTPDLAESQEAALPQDVQAEAAAAEAEAEVSAAPKKERRRAPRKPAARKGAAKADGAASADAAAADTGADTDANKAAADAADAAAVVDTAAVDTAAIGPVAGDSDTDAITDADPSDPAPADAQSGSAARKKSTRPAHKAPSRKPATRARRPAKPKTPEGA